MKHSFFRMAVVFGLLSSIGPFAIDMYLPALPAIGLALRTDMLAVQLSLMAFFISFAISQLVDGPASDFFGRKPPLYVGIALFIAGRRSRWKKRARPRSEPAATSPAHCAPSWSCCATPASLG